MNHHVTILAIEPAPRADKGAVCSADVSIDLADGITIELTGIRVLPPSRTRLLRVVAGPTWRDDAGRWRETVRLPPAAWRAVSVAVLALAAKVYPR